MSRAAMDVSSFDRYLRLSTRAGRRRHSVTLEEAVVVTDPLGGRTAVDWVPFGQWWVGIVEETFFKDEKEASQTYMVIGLYRGDVVEKHAGKIMLRVVLKDTKTLKVILVQNPGQRNRDLILHCVEAG